MWFGVREKVYIYIYIYNIGGEGMFLESNHLEGQKRDESALSRQVLREIVIVLVLEVTWKFLRAVPSS
jgi:hypothetical protein